MQCPWCNAEPLKHKNGCHRKSFDSLSKDLFAGRYIEPNNDDMKLVEKVIITFVREGDVISRENK